MSFGDFLPQVLRPCLLKRMVSHRAVRTFSAHAVLSLQPESLVTSPVAAHPRAAGRPVVCAVFPPKLPVAPLWPGAVELACVPSPSSQGGEGPLCPIVGIGSGHAVKVCLWAALGGGDVGGPMPGVMALTGETPGGP